MKRMFTFKRGESSSRPRSSVVDVLPSPDDSPEIAIVKAINAFCASGGPASTDADSEVLHLPTIVDSAESSPTAARSAASTLRKQLDLKNNSTRPYVQYNAIMLLRILSDNPGPTFTRNLAEPKFISAVKSLLREGKDPSVRQILSETLEYFEVTKPYDEGLKGLREVWAKEKKNHAARTPPPPLLAIAPPPVPHQSYPPTSRSRTRSPPGLPSMSELVARIAEAQTSASLLSQLLQSTPQLEVPGNELVKEFADRCRAASKSVIAYISADPPLDEDTLTTLIETNDALGIALAEWRSVMSAAQMTQGDVGDAGVQDEDSRIVDMPDLGSPVSPVVVRPVMERPAGEGLVGERPAGERPVVIADPSVGGWRNAGEIQAPPSPVSPVSPDHPISYRY